MMLILWPFHCAVVAAEVIVIPRSCSCSSSPSLRRPRGFRPAYGFFGVEEDTFRGSGLTASICAIIPIFLVFSNGNSLPAILIFPPMFYEIEEIQLPSEVSKCLFASAILCVSSFFFTDAPVLLDASTSSLASLSAMVFRLSYGCSCQPSQTQSPVFSPVLLRLAPDSWHHRFFWL